MLLAMFRAAHPFPSILVAGLTVALVPLADRGAPLRLYVALGLAMLAFQFAIGLVNDLVDVEDDRRRKPWKPLVRGRVSPRAARLTALGCIGLGVALLTTLPLAAALVGIVGVGAGLAYDLGLKQTSFSWLPYSVALPLLPIWVFLAAEAWEPLLWWALPLGGVLGFALHLANEVPDVGPASAEDGERVEGLPARLGERRSRMLAVGLFAAVAALVVVLTLGRSPAHAALATAVGVATSAATPFSTALGRDGLFGLLAVGSALLALLFLMAV